MTIHLLQDALPDAPPNALPDALEPGFHCVRTRWNRGFMAFKLAGEYATH
jgi:hypothetical protein